MTITAKAEAPDRRRQIHRLGGDFQLKMARLVALSVNRDFTTALVLLALSRANVRPIMESGESVQQYGAADAVPPDALRAPVTIYVLARELGLPYETVRRHVSKLKAAGLCQGVEGGGVIVPGSTWDDPIIVESVTECWRMAVGLVEEAASFGIIAPGVHAPAGPEVARHVIRLAIIYFLDAMRIMADAADLDMLSVLVLRMVAVGNVTRLTHDPQLARDHSGLEDIPSDEHRVPVSAYAVSKFLLLPYETARRILLRLAELGLLERRGRSGLVVPASIVAQPAVVAGTVKLAALTEAFLVQLAEVGVVPGSRVPRQPVGPACAGDLAVAS